MLLKSSRDIALLSLFALLPCPAQLITRPAQPSQYLEAAGRRAALLGAEDGSFEAWVYPIKVLRGFRLSVYVDNAMEPSPLAPLTTTVEVRAGSSTLTHTQAAFTIRQTWVASVDKPVAAILLDIETSRPLKLRASFVPEMKPMWPASFGGQSTGWDEKSGVLTFTEGMRRYRPVLGSPRFSRISEQIGHQLPDRTILIEFDVDKSGTVPILIAGSRADYDEALRNPGALLTAAQAHYQSFLQKTTRIEMSGLTGAYDWARLAIEKGWACNDGAGCGLVAGWAPSGLSERPGFGWYFGGDTMMSAWAMQDYGDFAGARAALEFLIARQRQDGKIMHEYTQSTTLLDWSKFPYGYYHADTTPLFLFSAARYIRQSGDREFLKKHWDVLNKSYQFCLTMLDDDGLLSNEKGGAAAVETGALSGKVRRDIYLQGVWLGGLAGYADMAGWAGQAALDKEARRRLGIAREAVKSWFVPDKGLFAFAQLKDGSRYEANSGWQGFLAAYGGIDERLARQTARALALPALATPWGTRLFATDSPFYNPLGYNDGSVWPFVTAQAAMAMFLHGQPEAGYRYLHGMAQATGLAGAGFIPEYFSGDRFAIGPRAVPHQLFSSVAIITPLIRGLLGLDGNGLDGTLRVAPRLPCGSDPVRITGFRVGASSVSGIIGPGNIDLTVDGPPLSITREPGACFPAPQLTPLTPGQRAE
jgi:glycogen debranching enzyme